MYIFCNVICRSHAFQALYLTPESSVKRARPLSTELYPEPQNSNYLERGIHWYLSGSDLKYSKFK